MTVIELLEKEIKSLNYRLHNAQKKPNVDKSEISNITEKIRLKTETLKIVERSIM